MVFLAPGTEADALRRVAAHVRADGFVVTGFHTDRELSLDAFDRAVAEAGLRREHRFATWDLRAMARRCRLRCQRAAYSVG